MITGFFLFILSTEVLGSMFSSAHLRNSYVTVSKVGAFLKAKVELHVFFFVRQVVKFHLRNSYIDEHFAICLF